MDSEADSGMDERAVLPGTGGDRAGNEMRRMLPIREEEEVGIEQTAVATDVPTSIEAWVAGGEQRQMVNVNREKSDKFRDGMGVSAFPDLEMKENI